MSSTEFKVNSYSVGHQTNPLVFSLSDGGFVVTWNSDGQDGEGDRNYFQRFDKYGIAAGEEFQAMGAHYGPHPTTGLSDGGFVITYMFSDGDETGVFGQLFDSSFTKIGDEFLANTETADDQEYPSVTSLSDGGFVISWLSYHEANAGIYGQRYDSSGSKIGNEFKASSNTVPHGTPSLTNLNDGGFVITWGTYLNYGIYGQRYDSFGTKVGDEFQVDSSGYELSVASLDDGGFIVTWQGGDEEGIYGQRYDSSGTKVGDKLQIHTYSGGEQETPSVTGTNDGGFVVTWISNGQDGDSYGIFGQRYDSSNEKVGGEFQINTENMGLQVTPSVTNLEDGGFVVTWQSYGQDGDGFGIYGQRFDAEGSKIAVHQPDTTVTVSLEDSICYLFCFDDFGVASLDYDNVTIYDYNANWEAGWNYYNLDSLEPDELSQLPYFKGFGLEIISDDINGTNNTFDDENDEVKATSDNAVADYSDDDEENDYYAWSFDEIKDTWVLDFLNDLDGNDEHPWLPEGLEQGLYLTNYEIYEDLDGEVDFYNINGSDEWDKVDLDPTHDYVFYNWEENVDPVVGTESYSLLTVEDINRLENTDYLPNYLTHGDIVLNNFFDQLDGANVNNVKVIAIDISDEVDGEDIWNDQYFMDNFDTLVETISLEHGITSDDLLVANFSNTIPGSYPSVINQAIQEGLYVAGALPNDGKWANRYWDPFIKDAILALPDAIKVSGTEDGQKGFPLALPYSDVAAPSDDSRQSGGYGTSYATPKVAAELVNLYFDTVSSGDSFEDYSISEISTNLSEIFVDTLQPTVSIAMSDQDIKVGDTSTVTFTFSEEPTGFTADDVTVANGAISDLTGTSDAKVYTAKYTPTADIEDATNVISVGTDWADAAGNAPAAATDSSNYEVDTLSGDKADGGTDGDIFEPADWNPSKHIIIKDKILEEASYTGLDLNWSSISSEIGASLPAYTIAFDNSVHDLADIYSDLQSYDSLRINLKGTALNDFITIGEMANQDNFASYWQLGVGNDVIKVAHADGLRLQLRDGFENFASGDSEWLSEISYEATWKTDHYEIAVIQDGMVLGTTAIFGPVNDFDISSDTTITLSDRGEHVEYISGKANLTMGVGSDIIELSFEREVSSKDQLSISSFSNGDIIEVSYDPDAYNVVDIMQEYELSEIIELRHNVEKSETYA
ncbi:Ig-like domain-containing protein, partial [Rhodobacteraceae bacterium]|nr:Ig-like domain-containing protein [Paracoccaceae bacterium]